jgi:hypothetical protein
MGVDNGNPEVLKIIVPRRRQGQVIADPLALLVGSGDHTKRKSKVAGVSCHRTRHGKVAAARHRWSGRQAISAQRDQAQGWLVPEDAAEMGRHANGSSNVRTERKRTETSRERSGRRE